MKKINAKDLCISFVATMVLMQVLAVVISFVLTKDDTSKLGNALPLFCILGGIVGVIVWAISLSWGGSDKKSKATFEKGLKDHNFDNCVTFKANDSFLAIDQSTGRIGYVSNSNSKAFQIAEAKDITDIKSDHMPAPMGGTSGVYFSFKYNGKKTKLYTFLTNSNYSMKSSEVMEAVSKADYYADLLHKAVEISKGM